MQLWIANPPRKRRKRSKTASNSRRRRQSAQNKKGPPVAKSRKRRRRKASPSPLTRTTRRGSPIPRGRRKRAPIAGGGSLATRIQNAAIDGALVFGGSLAATVVVDQVNKIVSKDKPFNAYARAGVKVAAGIAVGELLGKGNMRRYLRPFGLGMIASATGDLYADFQAKRAERAQGGGVAGWDDAGALDGYEDTEYAQLPMNGDLSGSIDSGYAEGNVAGLAGQQDTGYAL
jgi:hypothetical protein